MRSFYYFFCSLSLSFLTAVNINITLFWDVRSGVSEEPVTSTLFPPLPPKFSLKIELVYSSDNFAPICQARRRHIPNVCNIVVVVLRNFTYIFYMHILHVYSIKYLSAVSWYWSSYFVTEHFQYGSHSLHPSHSHMYSKIYIKHGMNCLLCPVHPSDFPLAPKTKVRKNRIGGMIKCGHVNTKYWFGRGSYMCLSVCVCVWTSRACLTNPSLEQHPDRV